MLLFMCSCSCAEKPDGGGQEPEQEIPEDVTVYVTTADAKSLFVKSGIGFSDLNVLNSSKILYDKTALLQEVDGFGLAITTASCYNLLNMSQEDRTAFLTQMFSPTEGVGSSLIRVASF